MLPRNLLSITRGETFWTPSYLGERDRPWVAAILERAHAYVGRMASARDGALPREAEEVARPLGASPRAIAAMLAVVCKLQPTRIESELPPLEVRRVVFAAAAAGESFDRDRALAEASTALGLDAASVERALFADRAPERIVAASGPNDPEGAMAAYNLALTEGLLKLSEEVSVDPVGREEAVLEFVRRSGLMCIQRDRRLFVSGPLAVLRRTAKYGHRFATFFPLLLGRGLPLDLRCVMKRARVLVRIERPACFPAMPVVRAREQEPRERALARDLAPLGWSLRREGRELLLCGDCGQIAIEIIGFHTPEYLRTKLAEGPRILCVDQDLACRDGPLPVGVLRFRKTIDARALTAAATDALRETFGST